MGSVGHRRVGHLVYEIFTDVYSGPWIQKPPKMTLRDHQFRHFDQPYGDGSRPVVVKMIIYVHRFSGDEHP